MRKFDEVSRAAGLAMDGRARGRRALGWVARAAWAMVGGLLGGGTAWAQAAPGAAAAVGAANVETVVVTGTRVPEPLSQTLADISVIDRSAIARSGSTAVSDVLAGLPGIGITRNGGPGATTSVNIRGGEQRHTAVYLDGIRLDSQATGGVLWEQIPLEQIDRIEVLRGAAAAVYGSDAMTGVVQLFTKRGAGKARPYGSVSLGSYGTAQAQAGVSGSNEVLDYALSIAAGRSDGYDARTAAAAGHNTDKDGWRRSSFQGRIGAQIHRDHRLEASVLQSGLSSGYDNDFSTIAGADDQNRHRLRTATLAWEGHWTDDAKTRLRVGETNSILETQPSFYRTETTLRDLTLQQEWWLGTNQLTGLLERREDRLLNPSQGGGADLRGQRHQDAIGLGWRRDFGPLGLQVHLRQDRDSEFGRKGTGSLGWGWAFLTGWRMTASTATTFRAPTLYQRFSEYGDPTLTPESGRNIEWGLRWKTKGGELSLNAWRNEIRDLIDWRGGVGTCPSLVSDPVWGGCYANVGRARLQGQTLAGSVHVSRVKLRGSMDWQDPRNLVTDKILPRRAKRSAALAAETALQGWTLGAEWKLAGSRFDDASNTKTLAGYGIVNMYFSRVLRNGLTLEGRIDNLGDRPYELASTFAAGGLSGHVGLRWSMR
jgi:vitamin B12 transporter